jgi:hypothetical protein
MKKLIIYLLGLILIGGIACQKELSFELGDSPAEGSLQSDVSGDCLPKTVNGIYAENSALVPTANTITVSVNVTKTGTYAIGTDTVNGYYFRGVGTFTTLGANTVTLRGFGTPFAQGINNFVVSFDGTVCDIQVTVLPPGSGPATFTLAGAPGSCTTPVINGTYVAGGPLNATNTVVLNVNVTVAGTYNVTTTLTNGMTFAGTGALTTGAQTITLIGTGTPTTAGNTTIPVTVGATTCSFTIPVVAPVAGTLGGGPGTCTPATINGTYTQGVALTAANTVQVQITTAAIGPYSVSTNTVAGISFSGSGTSTGATETITLNGTGTPTATGPQIFTVTFGTSTCTFTLNMVSSAAVYTADCTSATPDGLYEATSQLNCSNSVDIVVNVTVLGPYTITTTATNGMTFSASGTFTTLGAQTITLAGSGTPAAAGNTNIPMPGATPCTFVVPVDPAPTVDWKFTVTNAPATTYQGQTDDAQLIPAGPTALFVLIGSNSAGSDALSMALQDANGTIVAGETYSTSALVGNAAAFQYDLAASANCTDTYSADPTITGVTMVFTVTSHNVATKTITGTFTGTAKNSAAGTMTITTGTFTGTYP